jgi:hypothetical protein
VDYFLGAPPPPPAPGGKRPGSAKRSKNASFLTPVEVTIPFPDPPPGAVRHGYEDYFVQELVLHGQVTRYRRERLRTPDGRTLLAPLPDDVRPGSHFGPTLTAYVLNQHHQGNVTQPLLLEQLRDGRGRGRHGGGRVTSRSRCCWSSCASWGSTSRPASSAAS